MAIPEFPWISVGAALGGTTLLLWLGVPLARRIGWVDRPDARKQHRRATPLIGGFAMFGGYVVALLLLDGVWPSRELFFLITGIVLSIGCLDDCLDVRARVRFLAEFGIAMMISAWGEVQVHSLGNLLGLGNISLGHWSIVFTLICIVGVINAINMSDGLDGQTGGQSLVSFLLMFFLAARVGRWQEAWWMLLAVAVLLPFLLFNAPLRGDAKVFMGDSGSMFLGTTLAWFSIVLSQEPYPAFTPVTALWLLAVPLIDLFSSILRRLMTGHPPFAPDLGHIHHLLLSRGYSKKQVFIIMVGQSFVFAMVGLGGFLLAVPEAILFYGLLAVFAGYCWLGFRWRNAPPKTQSSP